MKLDRLIQKLIPHDEKFFDMLEESTENLVDATLAMKGLVRMKGVSDRDSVVRKIKELEHIGDNVTHKIFSELNATFVTPLDREDIHILTSSLDDIMDHIDGSAARFTIYKLTKVPVDVIRLADILHESVVELQKGVRLLRDTHHYDDMQRVFKSVNEYENQADRIFEDAISKLFEKEKNPIQVIKLKEIYVGLETATDKCEDAANVLESILIKNA
jgi:predicted phosphate transport protein (TIGR00153 family)